jgi:hypothetical protein
MKLTRLCFVLAALFTLSACTSWQELREFHSRKKSTQQATQTAAAPAPSVTPSVAPSEPAQPEAPAPVIVPEVVAAPIVPPANTTPEPAAAIVIPTPPPAAPEPMLKAAKTDQRVNLTWTLPVVTNGYKAIEIMRNTSDTAMGRTRVRTVRATVTAIEDQVPQAAEHYWYWLKLTTTDGVVSNIGPVEAK